nr:uncharacterized mitochondrial protein AtMg00810-like [Tanacetum cinerariifolium]
MENVQDKSGCSVDQKVKYTAGSFMGKALTWWNSQIHTLSRGVAVSLSWNEFKFMMIEEFYHGHEMKELETKLWNHVMVEAGHAAYTDRFHELARMVAAAEPKTIQKAVQIFGALTDEVVRNRSNKKEERIWVFGLSIPPAIPTMHPEGLVAYASTARGKAFMLGAEEAHQDPNIMTGTFTLNNHFATTLFDSGADYSFVSTTFIPPLGIKPSELGFRYEIEIASEHLVEIDKVIRVCKLEIKVHVFDIDLIPFGHGSFDVIIGIKFRIELIHGAKPVAKYPYRLAPYELEELSGQLKELQDKDDILIYSKTLEEHVKHLRLVLELLKKEEIKIEAVKNLKALRTPIEVYSFLGLVGYYRRGTGIDISNLNDKLRNAPILELFSDYDCEIRYHPVKVNVVDDALSRKERVKPKRVRSMNMTFQIMLLSKADTAAEETEGITLRDKNRNGDQPKTSNPAPPNPPPTQQIPYTVSSIQIPILKKGEYDIWAMKIEHYLSHIDYPIWQVIQNGNGPISVTTYTNGMIKVLPFKTAKEVMARERERKARTTLLMALPEDQLVKFHKMANAKETFQTLLSQLEIHGVFERDVNDTTASSSSNTHNVAFVSADNTSSTNDINDADMEEMDLKWQDIDWSGQVKKDAQNYAMMAYSSNNPDNAPKIVCEPKVWSDAPIIEEYESDSDDDSMSNVQENIEKPSFSFIDFVKHVKSPRENIKETDTPNHIPRIKKHDRYGHTRKGLGYTRKACFVCGSFSHLIRDYDFHEKRMAKQAALTKRKDKVTGQKENRPARNNVQRVKHQNKLVSSVLLTKTGKFLVNAARQNFSRQATSTSTACKVNTARPFVNDTRPKRNFYKTHSPNKSPFHNKTAQRTTFSYHKVNTVNTSLSVLKGNWNTAVKASTENQANKSVGLKDANYSVGTEANDDQGANSEEIDLHDEYFVLPIWSAYSTTVKSSGTKTEKTTDCKTCEKPVSQVEQIFLEELEKLKRPEKEANDAARKEVTHEIQNANTNNTNLLNAVSTPISTVGLSIVLNDGEPSYLNDHSMPHLEDIYASQSEMIFIDSSYNDKGVVTNFNNLETIMSVSPTPTTRIHTIHTKTQILRDPLSAVQTRSKVHKNSKAHALKYWCDEFEELMKNRFQMSSMGEITFFLGLQVKQKEDGIFISPNKYVAKILKKFDFLSVKTASTPIETQKPLVKDEEAANVDVHLYRSMIGSLMYLTDSRLDIMFAVCACSRFQVTPKTSHLQAVKRIFSDYAGTNLDRKFTTGGCQFLASRLISWQCKKQTIVATTTEVEYVAAAHCCGQVL